MVVVERHGLPLGFLLASANRAEAPLAEQTLDTLCVRPVCGGHAGIPGGVQRNQSNGSRFGDMIDARCDARCVGVCSGCVFRPSDGWQAGEPSAVGLCSRTRTTIDSALL